MQHPDINQKKWNKLNIYEKMANIGSEVERAMKWKKINQEFSNLANIRALELFDLTLNDRRLGAGLKEIARARELWLDFFAGENIYNQTEIIWHNYFYAFTYAARIKR